MDCAAVLVDDGGVREKGGYNRMLIISCQTHVNKTQPPSDHHLFSHKTYTLSIRTIVACRVR